jgi:hypothetical protein
MYSTQLGGWLLLLEIYGPTSKSFGGAGILRLEVNTLLDLARCPQNYNE